jgi:hypothetical protein
MGVLSVTAQVGQHHVLIQHFFHFPHLLFSDYITKPARGAIGSHGYRIAFFAFPQVNRQGTFTEKPGAQSTGPWGYVFVTLVR